MLTVASRPHSLEAPAPKDGRDEGRCFRHATAGMRVLLSSKGSLIGATFVQLDPRGDYQPTPRGTAKNSEVLREAISRARSSCLHDLRSRIALYQDPEPATAVLFPLARGLTPVVIDHCSAVFQRSIKGKGRPIVARNVTWPCFIHLSRSFEEQGSNVYAMIEIITFIQPRSTAADF